MNKEVMNKAAPLLAGFLLLTFSSCALVSQHTHMRGIEAERNVWCSALQPQTEQYLECLEDGVKTLEFQKNK